MTPATNQKPKNNAERRSNVRAGQDVLKGLRANEVFIAIVGPAGAGCGTAARILEGTLGQIGYGVETIKASHLIRNAARHVGKEYPAQEQRKSIEAAEKLQDLGDQLRNGELYGGPEDHSAVARLMLAEIQRRRIRLEENTPTAPRAEPHGEGRAYIMDSLRHPAEVKLLREVYLDAFALLGICCDPAKREKRVREKFYNPSQRNDRTVKDEVRKFLTRDEDAPDQYGQHVADTFHEADFFADNSEDSDDGDWTVSMNNQLFRFSHLITRHKIIIRPTISETAMHHARSAQMRSACLSRQVGAALVDSHCNIVATGTNDVPKAGGGLYGESFCIEEGKDERCAYCDNVYCRNNREQNRIIDELISEFPELTENRSEEENRAKIRNNGIGGLLEFSRAVHAEINAILSAAISGVSPHGCRLFVTTYPCHYCARHIVASGIDEVQFIEPYPKSKAVELHGDSITTEAKDWKPPSEGGEHVLFRPFIGVAPRFYRKAFLKDRQYKDKTSGNLDIGEPKWGHPTALYKESYLSMEEELALDFENG